MFIPMIYSCDAAILDEKKELVCELGFGGLLQITCKQLNMGLCMCILQKINVVYYKLQLEGGPNIPLTCSNVQLVFGIPPVEGNWSLTPTAFMRVAFHPL